LLDVPARRQAWFSQSRLCSPCKGTRVAETRFVSQAHAAQHNLIVAQCLPDRGRAQCFLDNRMLAALHPPLRLFAI
jgi:hypothetical protein